MRLSYKVETNITYCTKSKLNVPQIFLLLLIFIWFVLLLRGKRAKVEATTFEE